MHDVQSDAGLSRYVESCAPIGEPFHRFRGMFSKFHMILGSGIAGKTKKAKDKLPGKPKPAAVIFAEEQVENQVLDQASNFPMFDAKKLRSETRKVVLTDSLQDWEDGKISEELVQEFTKKAEGALQSFSLYTRQNMMTCKGSARGQQVDV